MKVVPLEIKMRVLSAIDYAPGQSINARIRHVAEQTFENPATGLQYKFTWRTISTWLYRLKNMVLSAWTEKPEAINTPNERSKPMSSLKPFMKYCLTLSLIKQAKFLAWLSIEYCKRKATFIALNSRKHPSIDLCENIKY